MPIARQLAVASLGLAALATTSCPATRAQSGAEHASTMTAVTRAGAEAASRLVSRRGLFEPDIGALGKDARGDWPAPTPDQVAELEREVVPAAMTEPLSVDPAAQPKPPPAFSLARIDPDRALASIARETYVMLRPSWQSKKIGYLRAGAVVSRSAKPVGNRGCEGGWYEISPEGYVCVGKTATLDLSHPIAVAARRGPDRSAPMPYEYGMARFPTPPFYTKVPTEREQRQVEQELAKHLSLSQTKEWDGVVLGPIPEMLEDGAPAFTWGGVRHSPGSVYTGRAMVKSGFAFLSFFESQGRAFGLSVDLDVMPLDRMKRVTPSEFEGLALSGDASLPVVFVRARGARLYQGDPRSKISVGRELGYREAIAVKSKRLRVGGVTWLETQGGDWIRDEFSQVSDWNDGFGEEWVENFHNGVDHGFHDRDGGIIHYVRDGLHDGCKHLVRAFDHHLRGLGDRRHDAFYRAGNPG